MPSIYVPHGGGPWPWVEPLAAQHGTMRSYFEGLGRDLPRPKAILVISAHWEADRPTVMTAAKPPMLYDYYGFPEHTYGVTWPAPGAPDLALRIVDLLGGAGIEAGTDAQRGFDHGCFVPLALAYPEADVPTLQLSLVNGLDPKPHLQVGAALAPLRSDGVLILGSGMSYHNMQGFARGGPAGGKAAALAFDGWLEAAMTQTGLPRDEALRHWEAAPGARLCHPREEHLMPLHVVAGAAHGDAGTLPYRDEVLGVRVSSVRFDAAEGEEP